MLNDYTVIFGGSFDPPHSGHVAITGWLLNSLMAKKIIICPTASHCFGKDLSLFEHRLDMCNRAFDHFDNVRVSDIEFFLPKPNLTYNLVKSFKDAGEDKVAIIIGSDNFSNTGNWSKWDDLIKEVKIIVIERPGHYLYDNDYDAEGDIEFYDIGVSTISSTIVRDRIKKSASLEGYVPYKVKDYISINGLYK